MLLPILLNLDMFGDPEFPLIASNPVQEPQESSDEAFLESSEP